MSEIDDSKPMTLFEMKQLAKEAFGEEFANEEDMFVDAFSNGAYHEEEPLWYLIAESLPNRDITRLAGSTIHILIRGVGGSQDSKDLRVMMVFFESLRRFLDGHLKSPDEILLPLENMRLLVFRCSQKRGSGWWIDTLRAFSLVEFAIRRKLGLLCHDLNTAYDDAIARCSKIGE